MRWNRVVIGFILSFLSLVLFIIPSGANQGRKDKPAKLVTQAEIDRAIDKGVAYLKKQQRKKGTTALTVYTLLKCGLNPDDKTVATGLKYLLNKPCSYTYSVSVMAMAFATALEKRPASKESDEGLDKPWSEYYKKLKKTAKWLIKAQHPHQKQDRKGDRRTPPKKEPPKKEPPKKGIITGDKGYDLRRYYKKVKPEAWGYELRDRHYYWDNSNTQFALLGLRVAQNVRIKVPKSVWEKALAHLVSTQNKDGGWSYRTCDRTYERSKSYGSMTAAGICGMIICLASLEETPELDKIIKAKEISNAIKWLKKNWDIKRGRSPWSKKEIIEYYWLYSLERACMLGGIKQIGSHDWYQEGASLIIKEQQDNGAWIRGIFGGEIVDTCFALLFLKRAYVPVITPSGHQLKPIITPGSKDKLEPSDKSPESSPKGDDNK